MTAIEVMFSSVFTYLGCLVIILSILLTIRGCWDQLQRHMTIRKHGYPPTHCDADGDRYSCN